MFSGNSVVDMFLLYRVGFEVEGSEGECPREVHQSSDGEIPRLFPTITTLLFQYNL